MNIRLMQLSFLSTSFLPVCSVGDCKDVGWNFMSFLALVHLDDLLSVDWKTGVGVDHNAEQAGVGLQNMNEASFRKVDYAFCFVNIFK